MIDEVLEEYVGGIYTDTYEIFIDHNQPIVRCMDCKFCRSMATKNGIVIFCTHFDDHRVILDGFCSWGERHA